MGHRLDRQTSGICIYSKNKEAAKKFSAILRDEQVHKVYIARVIGKIENDKFVIDKSNVIA